ncbi:hypothetical protein AYI69_g18 [Smittium culicis]|uniref:Uncharacterized protein n=1 Tax=Smittium culicis TaxID=133412 RepID=A0A1R1YU64_9FUNG|nr:hypothetical protein AYI69_g18 [Smittium culicis]
MGIVAIYTNKRVKYLATDTNNTRTISSTGLPAAYLKGIVINLPTERSTQVLLQVGWMTEVKSSHGIKLVPTKFNSLIIEPLVRDNIYQD